MAEKLLDGGLESFSTITNATETFGEVMNANPSFGFVEWDISTSNSRGGSKHARVSPTGSGSTARASLLSFGSEAITDSGGLIYPATPVVPGAEWTASVWLEASTTNPTRSLSYAYLRAVGGVEQDFGSTTNSSISVTTTYTQYSITGTVPDTVDGWVPTHIQTYLQETGSLTGAYVLDADDFSVDIATADVLYIQNRGFRFPYLRWQ